MIDIEKKALAMAKAQGYDKVFFSKTQNVFHCYFNDDKKPLPIISHPAQIIIESDGSLRYATSQESVTFMGHSAGIPFIFE